MMESQYVSSMVLIKHQVPELHMYLVMCTLHRGISVSIIPNSNLFLFKKSKDLILEQVPLEQVHTDFLDFLASLAKPFNITSWPESLDEW